MFAVPREQNHTKKRIRYSARRTRQAARSSVGGAKSREVRGPSSSHGAFLLLFLRPSPIDNDPKIRRRRILSPLVCLSVCTYVHQYSQSSQSSHSAFTNAPFHNHHGRDISSPCRLLLFPVSLSSQLQCSSERFILPLYARSLLSTHFVLFLSRSALLSYIFLTVDELFARWTLCLKFFLHLGLFSLFGSLGPFPAPRNILGRLP